MTFFMVMPDIFVVNDRIGTPHGKYLGPRVCICTWKKKIGRNGTREGN